MIFLLRRHSHQYGGRSRIGKLLTATFVGLLCALLTAPLARAGQITIAALGDSLTQGYGLSVEDGLVPQLEGWLHANGAEVTVLNAGVSGDTTAGGLARVDWTLTPDVDALIVALGGNDLLRGIDPAVARRNIDGILAAAASKGLPVLLIGHAAPGNYGVDYKDAFDALYPELAAQYGTLLYPSFLSSLSEGRDQADVLQTLMQADAIHPNAAGVGLVVQSLGPVVLELIAQVE